MFPQRSARRNRFPFESGCIALPDGKQFIPARDAHESWVVEISNFFECIENSYQILYLLPCEIFVLVEYDNDPFGDRRPRAQYADSKAAVKWLTSRNFSLPDCLANHVEWIVELPLRGLLADVSVVSAIREAWPTFNPNRSEDVQRFRSCLVQWFGIPGDHVEELTPQDVLRKMNELDHEAGAGQSLPDIRIGKVVVDSLEVGNATIPSRRQADGDQDPVDQPLTVIPFPTPAEARWSDVNIKFVDSHTVLVRVLEKSKRYSYFAMGLSDNRSSRPNLQWELLKSFAEGKGILEWASPDEARRLQKRRELLAKALQRFFQMDCDPIASLDGGWQTLFNIVPEQQ